MRHWLKLTNQKTLQNFILDTKGKQRNRGRVVLEKSQDTCKTPREWGLWHSSPILGTYLFLRTVQEL